MAKHHYIMYKKRSSYTHTNTHTHPRYRWNRLILFTKQKSYVDFKVIFVQTKC